MTAFGVETYVVKPEKQAEFMSLYQRILKYIEENPEKFKELKSLKRFIQTFGDICGRHIDMWEFDNLADYENLHKREVKDKEFIKLQQEFTLLIEPTTYSLNMGNTVE